MSIQHQRGRLPQAELVLSHFDAVVARLGAEQVPMTADHAILAGRLHWTHRDPVDRMLAAQSILLGVHLATNDAAFREAPGVTTLW